MQKNLATLLNLCGDCTRNHIGKSLTETAILAEKGNARDFLCNPAELLVQLLVVGGDVIGYRILKTVELRRVTEEDLYVSESDEK
jgi:hypothetical protein